MKINGCVRETRYICTIHKQPQCSHFKKEWRQAFDTPTVCYFGLPDRECRNKEAQEKPVAPNAFIPTHKNKNPFE